MGTLEVTTPSDAVPRSPMESGVVASDDRLEANLAERKTPGTGARQR